MAYSAIARDLSEDPKPQNTAQGEQPSSNAQQSGSSGAVAPATIEPVKQVESAEYSAPCHKDQDNRNSDLCAQWKAADSAANAAWWAEIQTYLSAAGIIGLLYSLYLTRTATKVAVDATKDADRALDLAAQNANAATEANQISREIYALQNRPWMAHKRMLHRTAFKDNEQFSTFGVEWINSGKTPATDIQIWNQLKTFAPDVDPNKFRFEYPASGEENGTTLGPGLFFAGDFLPVSLDYISAAIRGDIRMVICSRVEYSSIFLNRMPSLSKETTKFHTEVSLEIKCASIRHADGGIEAIFDYVPIGLNNSSS